MGSEIVFPKFRWVVAVAAGWSWLTFAVVSLVFSPMLPVMAHEFDRPIGTLVIAVLAVGALSNGFAIMCAGPLVDRFGPRKLLLWSSVLVLLYCGMIPFCSRTVGQLVALRILQGIVVAPVVASFAALIRRWFPFKEQGGVLGIINGMYPVGLALLFLIVPWLMQVFHGNWRMVAALAGVLAAIQVVLMAIIMLGKEPAMVRPAPPRGGVPRNDFGKALWLPVFWVGVILLTISQGILQSVVGMFPSFLMAPPPTGLGWNAILSGKTVSFINLGMIVSGILMGLLLQKVFRGNARWLAAASYLGTCLMVCLLCMPFTHSRPATVAAFFFFVGALMNFGWPTISAFIAANYPPHILGSVFAISSGISLLGGAIISGVCGMILNATRGFTAVFGLIGLFGLVACVLAATILKPVTAFKEEPQRTVAAG